MPAQNRTTLKSYFETGDQPTEEQFADLIDSLALGSEVPEVGTAAAADVEDFATAAQGALAESAVQPADLPTFPTLGTAASADVEDFAAASHTHQSSSIVNVGASRILGRATAGSGAAEELTLSQALDLIGSAAQGDILYRGSSAWTRLAAGTAGQVLSTQGSGANPQWVNTASGTWPITEETLVTDNFNVGTASRSVVVDLTSNDVVAMFPATPTNGQIVEILCRGIALESLNRLTQNWNGKTVDGAGSAVVTKILDFQGQSNVATYFAAQGLSSITTSNGSIYTNGLSAGFQTTHYLGIDDGFVQFTESFASDASISFLHAGQIVISVDGEQVASYSSGTVTLRTVAVPSGVHVIRLASGSTGQFLTVDNLTLSNCVATPSEWTEDRPVGPGGAAAFRYSDASETWHELFRRET
jgi:hypothetical protein